MKIKVLRIKDWDALYENNRTRELKTLDWFPMRNKHDGDGFTELLDHPNGIAHYGAWVLILQVASKCREVALRCNHPAPPCGETIPQNPAPGCDNPALRCGGRGTLLREGARPHDAKSLARVTRGNEAIFNEVIPRLLEMQWLEIIEVTQLPQNPAPGCDDTIPHNPAPGCDNPAPGCDKVPSSRTRARAFPSVPFSSVPREGVGGVAKPIDKVDLLKTWLCEVFQKTPGVIWPNNEEFLIVDLSRRPLLSDEISELQTYRVQNLRYFPRSSSRLLEQWDKTLDEARSWKETHADENPRPLTDEEKMKLALQ